MSTHVIVTFKTKPDKRAAFAELMQQVKRDLPQAVGCQAVSIFNDLSDDCVFTLVETWESQAAHKQHIDGVVASGGWAHIATHLATDPSSGYFKVL